MGRSTQDRGPQQGVVAGSFEASATLAEQARDTKALIPQAQSDGTLPWATTPTDPQTLQNRRDEWLHTVRCRQAWLQLPPSVRRQQTLDQNAQDPYDSIHPDGGLVDVWIMDDQTIVGDPALTNPLIDAVDITCQDPKRGGIRNRTKTHVIIYASQDQIQQHQLTWNLAALQGEATLNTPHDELRTLGATLGGAHRRRNTFRSKLSVMKGMRHQMATINEPAVELKLARHCLGASKVQHLLRIYGSDLVPELTQVDATINTTLNRIATGISDTGRRQAALGDMDRLAELRHPQVDHRWVYHIDPSEGTVLPPDVYQDALRHRFGCQFQPEAAKCQCCNRMLDVQCIHAGCCATAEATRGHYAVARALLAVAKAVDPTTTREDTFAGTQRQRPGDLTTGVLIDGRRVAIDIGSTSQSQKTPGNPFQDYVNLKLTKYRGIIENEFRAEGICFRAAVWS